MTGQRPLFSPRAASSKGELPSALEAAVLAALGTVDRSQRARAIDSAAEVVDPDQLVEAVADHANSRRRNAAIEALARGGSRSVPALVRALRHPDTEVVMFSAGVLARTGSAAAIPHLVSLLDHPDANVAQQVIDSLSQMRSSLAVDALIPMLDRDPWLRFAAVHALGEIGDRRAVGALVPLLDDPATSDAIVEALGKIGSAEALDHLFRVLRDAPDGASFGVCLGAIGEALQSEHNEEALQQLTKWAESVGASSTALEERLTRVLILDPKEDVLGGNTDARKAAAAIVKALRIQPLYTALVLAGRDPAIREVLELSAVSLGEEIAPTLELGLGAKNVEVRILACECLGSIGHRPAASAIEPLLDDPDPRVRSAAVTALMRLCHHGAVATIGRLLADPEASVRQAAAAALCRMDVEAVTDILVEVTVGRAVSRTTALAIMTANPHPRQRDFLVKSLGDADAEVRRAAALALARRGVADAIDLLEPLLVDPDRAVRAAMVEALAAVPLARLRQRLVEHAHADPETRTVAVCALLSVGESSLLPALAQLFAAEPVDGQVAIIKALAGRPDAAAMAFLTRQLGHRAPTVRRAAVLALKNSLSPTVIRSLAPVARDEDEGVRSALVELLGPSADPIARDTVARLALDPSQRVAVPARHWVERAAQTPAPAQRRP